MKRNRTASLALVGLFLWQTGCMSYQYIELDQLSDYAEVRVTVGYGAKYEMREPSIEADSLVGVGEHLSAIPLSDVTAIEARQPNTGATMALVVGVALVGAAIGFAAWAASDPCFGPAYMC